MSHSIVTQCARKRAHHYVNTCACAAQPSIYKLYSYPQVSSLTCKFVDITAAHASQRAGTAWKGTGKQAGCVANAVVGMLWQFSSAQALAGRPCTSQVPHGIVASVSRAALSATLRSPAHRCLRNPGGWLKLPRYRWHTYRLLCMCMQVWRSLHDRPQNSEEGDPTTGTGRLTCLPCRQFIVASS